MLKRKKRKKIRIFTACINDKGRPSRDLNDVQKNINEFAEIHYVTSIKPMSYRDSHGYTWFVFSVIYED